MMPVTLRKPQLARAELQFAQPSSDMTAECIVDSTTVFSERNCHELLKHCVSRNGEALQLLDRPEGRGMCGQENVLS